MQDIALAIQGIHHRIIPAQGESPLLQADAAVASVAGTTILRTCSSRQPFKNDDFIQTVDETRA
jgi:hypothetical protein